VWGAETRFRWTSASSVAGRVFLAPGLASGGARGVVAEDAVDCRSNASGCDVDAERACRGLHVGAGKLRIAPAAVIGTDRHPHVAVVGEVHASASDGRFLDRAATSADPIVAPAISSCRGAEADERARR